jgi:hypothetical protein
MRWDFLSVLCGQVLLLLALLIIPAVSFARDPDNVGVADGFKDTLESWRGNPAAGYRSLTCPVYGEIEEAT